MPTDFYTFIAEARGGIGGSGSPITYKYVGPSSSVVLPSGSVGNPPLAQTGGDIVQGEMVAWDATNRVLVRMPRTGGYDFVGVSRDSALSVQKLGNQAALLLFDMSVMTTGIHQFLGSAGDTYNHGDPVYIGVNPSSQFSVQQIVTKAGLGTAVQIGVVWLPDGTQRVGAVRVPVLIDNFTTKQTG